MSQLGSLPTGATGVETGSDSALTSSGVCAPEPGQLITDGTSFATGAESLLTASNPLPCELAPPTEDGFIWWRMDRNDPQLVTLEQSNGLRRIFNQFPPDIDQQPVDSNDVLLPRVQWADWTPNVHNGLGMGRWFRSQATTYNKVYPPGTFDQPTNDDEPTLFLVVVKPLDVEGGIFVTNRLNNNDNEMGLRLYHPGGSANQLPITSEQDTNGYVFSDGIVSYNNQTILMTYEYWGETVGGANPVPNIYVNGVLRPLKFGPIKGYRGVSGISLGFVNAVFGFVPNAFIGEVLGYRGLSYAHAVATFPILRALATTYAMTKWAITP